MELLLSGGVYHGQEYFIYLLVCEGYKSFPCSCIVQELQGYRMVDPGQHIGQLNVRDI